MSDKNFPWIRRHLADQIIKHITEAPEELTVFCIEADAGMGKTFLARDIGTQLQSPTGYEPSCLGKLYWSGILDVYDPETNNNRGIELRLMDAYAVKEMDFQYYKEAREQYELWFKTGITGSGLEEQRHKVEEAFAMDMKLFSEEFYPIIVIDTIERLEIASSPVATLETELYTDTAMLVGWLIYQICRLPRGAVILLGRPSELFYQLLKDHIERENKRVDSGFPDARRSEIDLQLLPLTDLDHAEVENFYDRRIIQYPQLWTLLDKDLQLQLMKVIGGKPLLLDLALQALLERKDPVSIAELLTRSSSLEQIERMLIDAYMNDVKPDWATLLTYLAMARNGLSEGLLMALEPARAENLMVELRQMSDLPFVKTRVLSLPQPGSFERKDQPVYFLHDAMYSICDEVMLHPVQVVNDTQKIVAYYDRLLSTLDGLPAENTESKNKQRESVNDIRVESLLYRMRANPKSGYEWYYQLADQAIRQAATSLDMRLADAMQLFLNSASEEPKNQYGLGSKIDRARVKKEMPTVFNDFKIDSGTLWMRRTMLRGKTDLARKIGESILALVQESCRQDQDHCALGAADFYLWYGQVLMYGYDIGEAQACYRRAQELGSPLLEQLNKAADSGDLAKDFKNWRVSMVMGRNANNWAYTYFTYRGRYSLALRELEDAIRLFRIGNIDEELANSSDNLGRVHALLGHELEAIEWILNGLELRSEREMIYREALTYTTMAQILPRFGRFEEAMRNVEEALVRFSRVNVARGQGLGFLGRGQVYRAIAEQGVERGEHGKDAIRYLDFAEKDLRDALFIFTSRVHEPIREIQVRNELGCCYRARHWILVNAEKRRAADIDFAFNQSSQYLHKASDLAKEKGYRIDWLDSLQDQAVLFHRAKKNNEARALLENVRSEIADNHKIQLGEGLPELDVEQRIDAYYKLMGQVELLQGGIIYQEAIDSVKSQNLTTKQILKLLPKQVLLETTEHYLLAVAYFTRFSSEDYTHRQTYSRILRRFKHCSPELMREINRSYLPDLQTKYGLTDSLISSLKRVFAMLEV